MSSFKESVSAQVDEKGAEKIIEDFFDLQVQKVKKLDGYDDLNFHFTCKNQSTFENRGMWPHGYVLKIINWRESNVEFFQEYINVLLYLKNENFPCSFPLQNKKGEYFDYWISQRDKHEGLKHIFFALAYLPGEILQNIQYNKEIHFSVGLLLKELHFKLQRFNSLQAFHRSNLPWSLDSAPNIIEKNLFFIQEEEKRTMIQQYCNEFRETVLQNSHQFDKGVIHGDLNLSNVLVQKSDPELDVFEIVGIIDFADMQNSCYIFDVALTACYISLHDIHHFDDGIALFLVGYEKEFSNLELQALKVCICIRVCQALTIGAHTLSLHPDNKYIREADSIKYGWTLLEKLSKISNMTFADMLQRKITAVRRKMNKK